MTFSIKSRLVGLYVTCYKRSVRLMYIAVAGRQMQNSMSMLYATQLLRTASENTKRYQSNEISRKPSRWAEITKVFICCWVAFLSAILLMYISSLILCLQLNDTLLSKLYFSNLTQTHCLRKKKKLNNLDIRYSAQLSSSLTCVLSR